MHILSEANTFTTNVTVVDDSDLVSPAAASLNVADQSMTNRTRWLKNRIGGARLATLDPFQITDSSSTAVSIPIGIATWTGTSFGSAHSLKLIENFQQLATYVPDAGDVVECQCSGLIFLATNAQQFAYGQIELVISFDGGSTWFPMTGAIAQAGGPMVNPDLQLFLPFNITGYYLVTSPGLPSITIGMKGRVHATANAESVGIAGNISMITKVWKDNS